MQYRILFTLFALTTGAAARAQFPAYTIQDLGDLGGGFSSASGLNNRGEVVGFSNTGDGRTRPFLYRNGVMQDLGTLYGPLTTGGYPPADMGNANAINDNGLIVGQTFKYTTRFINVGFRYSNGAMTEFDSGSILGVNNAGQSVGASSSATAPSHATLYSNGADIDLSLGDGSSANAINNSGQVVGRAGVYGAFLYQNGTVRSLGLPTGFSGSGANAISSNGIVAGLAYQPDSTLAGLTHAALWQNGQAFDLGTLGGKNSLAYGVNSAGVVVGKSDLSLPNYSTSTAFAYQNGVMYDLLAGSGWTLGDARGINDAGQIIGTGIHNGAIHAFLATPAAVPEPAFALPLALGVGWLALRRRRVRAAK